MTKLKIFIPGKIIVYFMLSLFLILSHNAFSQTNNNKNEISLNNGNIDFYHFVIDEYVWLIKNLYQGNDPFFVIVKKLYINDNDDIFSMLFSYTDNLRHLEENSISSYYPYNSDSTIYITISREICKDRNKRNYFDDLVNAKKVNSKIIDDIFFPLSLEYTISKSQTEKANVTYFGCYMHNDLYEVTKFKNMILARKNNKSIVYFTNYKPKNDIKKE